MNRRVRLFSVIGLVTTSAILFLPTAANASATGVEVGGGVVVTPAQFGAHISTATLTAVVTPLSLSTVSVAWTCVAAGAPDAVLTVIDECSINGVAANTASVPGPATAEQVGLATFPVQVLLQGCVASTSTFAETILGSGVAGGSACGPIPFVFVSP